MKSVGTYGDAEATATEKFAQAFKNMNFPPGAFVFFRQSPDGILGVSNTDFVIILISVSVLFLKPRISFCQDGTIPGNEGAVGENKAVSEAVLETMIGEHIVSSALKRSLASRLPALLNDGIIII
ncbi:Chalcone--flavonone isomerase [Spatholobus suberectus]|nr:Chalcone--flavonone isomerase [Spatholobus suberectus]